MQALLKCVLLSLESVLHRSPSLSVSIRLMIVQVLFSHIASGRYIMEWEDGILSSPSDNV